MKFKVEWHKKAKKELFSIPKKYARQILFKTRELAEEPMKKSFPLSGCSYRKIRVGEYRVILEVDFKKRKVKILLVGKRGNIYKKFFKKGFAYGSF